MENQEARLKAVERFRGLNIDTDHEFNNLLGIVSEICDAPTAVLSLIDNDTQWYKAKRGTLDTYLPRECSFCNYTIHSNDILQINDTLLDDRYKNIQYVSTTSIPRFYAGAPLLTADGYCIGTLSISDVKPKELNSYQLLALTMLSKQALGLMELRLSSELLDHSKKEFAEQQQMLKNVEISRRSFFESSPNFHVLLNIGGQVIDYNKRAFEFVEKVHGHKLVRGELLAPFIAPEFLEKYCDGISKALSGVNVFEEGSTDYGKHGRIYWEASFETARDAENNVIGISYIIRDVTDRKAGELKITAQNNFLLKIAHLQAHEFRGPLSSILGMMDLIKTENFEAPREYYELLEKAVANFDDKIKEIVSHIDEYKSAYEE